MKEEFRDLIEYVIDVVLCHVLPGAFLVLGVLYIMCAVAQSSAQNPVTLN